MPLYMCVYTNVHTQLYDCINIQPKWDKKKKSNKGEVI